MGFNKNNEKSNMLLNKDDFLHQHEKILKEVHFHLMKKLIF